MTQGPGLEGELPCPAIVFGTHVRPKQSGATSPTPRSTASPSPALPEARSDHSAIWRQSLGGQPGAHTCVQSFRRHALHTWRALVCVLCAQVQCIACVLCTWMSVS